MERIHAFETEKLRKPIFFLSSVLAVISRKLTPI